MKRRMTAVLLAVTIIASGCGSTSSGDTGSARAVPLTENSSSALSEETGSSENPAGKTESGSSGSSAAGLTETESSGSSAEGLAESTGTQSAQGSADAENTDSEKETAKTDSGAESVPAAAESNASAAAEYTYHLTSEEKYDYLDADDGSYVTYASVTYDILSVEPERDEYGEPTGAADPSSVTTAIDAINADTEATTGTFLANEGKEAQEYYDSLSEENRESFYSYGDSNTLTVVRADSRCLSVTRDRDQYLGGAHGYNETTAYSFNAETGEKLKIGDVLTDTNDLSSILASELLSNYDADHFDLGESTQDELSAKIQDLMDGDESYSGDNDLHYVTWYVDHGGVTFVFNEYLIASYASGQFKVTLTEENHPGLLNTYWTDGPESFAERVPFYSDFDVEGKKLLLGANENSDSMVDRVDVRYGALETSFEVMGYNPKAYLFTTAAGKFLYIDISGDNDWHNLYTVNLEADTLEAKLESELLHFDGPPIDPDHFALATSSGILSTLPISRSYHIDGTTGQPVPNEKYYHVSYYGENNVTLTLQEDAELTILGSLSGEETRKETVKKGTTMQFYRTDNDTIADCIADDGRYIRLNIDDSDGWPQRVDGTWNLEDLLDGTVFAG